MNLFRRRWHLMVFRAREFESVAYYSLSGTSLNKMFIEKVIISKCLVFLLGIFSDVSSFLGEEI